MSMCVCMLSAWVGEEMTLTWVLVGWWQGRVERLRDVVVDDVVFLCGILYMIVFVTDVLLFY